MKPNRVRITVAADCPECLLAHGKAEFVNGHVGIILGPAPYDAHGHHVMVGLGPDFMLPNSTLGSRQYFSEAELEAVEGEA